MKIPWKYKKWGPLTEHPLYDYYQSGRGDLQPGETLKKCYRRVDAETAELLGRSFQSEEPRMNWPPDLVERITRQFHQEYESRASDHGWKTQDISNVEWDKVPVGNRNLMLATVKALLDQGVIDPGPNIQETS